MAMVYQNINNLNQKRPLPVDSGLGQENRTYSTPGSQHQNSINQGHLDRNYMVYLDEQFEDQERPTHNLGPQIYTDQDYGAPSPISQGYSSQNYLFEDYPVYPDNECSGSPSLASPYSAAITYSNSNDSSVVSSFGSSYGSYSSSYEASYASSWNLPSSRGPASPQTSLPGRSFAGLNQKYGESCVSPRDIMFTKECSDTKIPCLATPATKKTVVGTSKLQQKTSDKSATCYACTHPGCKSEGQFRRPTDLRRHVETVHNPKRFDCELTWCGRTGEHGFTRRDHYTEHLREVHQRQIEKSTKKKPTCSSSLLG